MKFHIKIPDAYIPEQEYIIRTIFVFFWETDISIEPHHKKTVEIRNAHSDKVLIVNCDIFLTQKEQWLTPQSLPPRPLQRTKISNDLINPVLVADEIPVIYGKLFNGSEIIQRLDDSLMLGIDIFGSAFFMMSRYEEVVQNDLDALERFPAEASLAYQESFLERPIINEYLEILWSCIKLLWPTAERRKRSFSISVSHDVDAPFKYYLFNAIKMGKKTIKTSLQEGLSRAGRELYCWKKVKTKGANADPYNTFIEIMNISEQHNCRSAFYFITEHTDKDKDGHYEIDQPVIKNILKRISDREHEIGLHPSFNSFDKEGQIMKEFQKLKIVCDNLHINQDQWGGRQHYLRWKTPDTFQYWEEAGLDYDSTLSYAGQAGFRCGICYPYPVFDVCRRKKLSILEKPLVVMEATVLDERYMGMKNSPDEALNITTLLKDRCKLFGGDFTLLWHNNRFVEPEEKEMYNQILQH